MIRHGAGLSQIRAFVYRYADKENLLRQDIVKKLIFDKKSGDLSIIKEASIEG